MTGSASRGLKALFALGIVGLLIIVGSALMVIPAGHVGAYDLFGKVADQSMAPGIHLVNPLATVHKVSVRTQEVKETEDVPSREGLVVNIDVSLLFSLEPAKAAQVFRSIGPQYIQVVVIPQLRSVVREVTAGYDAKALYTAERELLTQNIQNSLFPLLQERGVLCERILLRKIILPQKLSAAIESKLEAEQQAEQMKYVLDKKKQEAERKRSPTAERMGDIDRFIRYIVEASAAGIFIIHPINLLLAAVFEENGRIEGLPSACNKAAVLGLTDATNMGFVGRIRKR